MPAEAPTHVVRRYPALLQRSTAYALGKGAHISLQLRRIHVLLYHKYRKTGRFFFLFFLASTWSSRVVALFWNLRGYMGKYKFLPRFLIDSCSEKILASETRFL